ncbi:MAG TPA: hypothetical protein VGC67_07870 [Cellulomonas sp.]
MPEATTLAATAVDAADPGPGAQADAAAATGYADVVVIGAGQAGLAVAAHLVRSGFAPVTDPDGPAPSSPSFVVLDAASGPGGAWRERWPGLTMRTVNGVYELPGAPLPRFDPAEPAADALTRYFGGYEQEQGLAVRRPVHVSRVHDLGGPRRLLAVETTERARAVTGTATDAVPVPAWPEPARPGSPPSISVPASAPRVGLRSTDAVAARDAPGDHGRDLGDGAGACRPVPGPAPAPDAAQHHVARSTAGAGAGPAPDRPARRRLARTWTTRAVVNATGTWTRPFWPVYPGSEEFAGRQLHTHDFHLPEDLAGRRVLVVGGGISAVQHLLAIHPFAASTTWVTRRPPDWRDGDFSPERGRDAVALVDERTRTGLPPQSVVTVTGLPLSDAYRAGIRDGVLLARPMFARLVPDGAVWDPVVAHDPGAGWVSGPEHVPADVVLWATGFRAALEHLRPLGLRGAGGGIMMDGTQVVADPRVQLVGYGPSASTVGANRAGRAAVRQVRRLLGA